MKPVVASKLMNWMSKSSIPPERRLSQEARASLLVHLLFCFGASMSGVFLNLYLWRLTESLWVNGMYAIVTNALTPVGFALGGWLAKKYDRLFVFRLGILATALFYLLVIVIREQVADYYYLFALLQGISGGFYWIGYLTLMYDVSTDQNRGRYLALNFIMFTTGNLLGPALAGFVIALKDGLSGYLIVFTGSFILFLLTALGSFRMKMKQSHHKAYYLGLMPLVLKKNNKFLKSMLGWYIFGAYNGVLLFLPPILLYWAFTREDLVGYMNVLFSLLAVFTSYMISRLPRDGKTRLHMTGAAAGLTLGALFISWEMSVLTVIIFLCIHSIVQPFNNNTYSSHFFRIIGQLPLKGNMRIESIILREVFVNTGRITGILALILLAGNPESASTAYVILSIAMLQFLHYVLVGKGE